MKRITKGHYQRVYGRDVYDLRKQRNGRWHLRRGDKKITSFDTVLEAEIRFDRMEQEDLAAYRQMGHR